MWFKSVHCTLQSKREEQTNKLHEQLQQAESNALRDKLKQREKRLRARGHDTSLLEQTHNTALLWDWLKSNFTLKFANKNVICRSHRPHEQASHAAAVANQPLTQMHEENINAVTQNTQGKG